MTPTKTPTTQCLNVLVVVTTLRDGDYTLSHHFRYLSSVYVQMRDIKSLPLSQQYAVLLVHSFHSCNGHFVYVCFVFFSTFFFFFGLFTIILSFISVEICHRRTSILFEFPTGKKENRKNWKKASSTTMKRR